MTPIEGAVSMTDRRTFLKALAATGAVSLLPDSTLFGQSTTRLNVPGGAIDVHHHFNPPGQAGGGGRRPWSLELTLEQMDKFNISVVILSMTQNGDLLYDNTPKGRTEVRRGNDFGRELVEKHPGKFGQFGGIPMPDIDGSLKEIEYAFDQLKVDGIGIYTNDNKGRWPGDAYFEPMWQELNRRKAIVYMHPLAPPCCTNLKYGPGAPMLEYDFDIGRAVASIIVNGVMFRYPNITFMTVHSGGTVPMLVGRMKDRVPQGSEKYLPDGLYAEVRKWYFDVAHATFQWPFAAAKAFMPESHLLFGTDFAPEPIESTVNELPGLKLPRAFELALLRGNAEKLFPKFKAKT
jgi:predicted TIM-barrel fold metal-dependent hydrolase